MSAAVMPGRRAARQLGWWRANRFLMLRRVTQAGVLGVFLAGPVVGLWIVKGTLASSLVLGMLWLSDPLVVLQSLAAPATCCWAGVCSAVGSVRSIR